MKLDIAIGQSVQYKGREGQVVERSLEGNDVCILFSNGESLWVEDEALASYNPSIPLLEEDPIIDPFEGEDDDLYEMCGIF